MVLKYREKFKSSLRLISWALRFKVYLCIVSMAFRLCKKKELHWREGDALFSAGWLSRWQCKGQRMAEEKEPD